MGVGTAEAGFAFVLLGVVGVLGADVLEIVETANDHFTTGGGEAVGDDMLDAHGSLFLGVFFLGDGAPRDRNLKWGDGVERLAEGELHGAAHLAEGGAFENTVTGGDHAAESAKIEELAAKPFHSCLGFLIVGSFWLRFGGGKFAFLLLRFNNGTLLDEDVKAVGGGALASGREEVEKVADFALEANVGDEAAIGVGIEARHVAGIGVAVGIAIDDLE